jgi:hypothetical protein
MSPPGLMALSGSGVSTSPSVKDLKSLAQLVLSNVGADIGVNEINRLVTRFVRQAPNCNGWTFFLYLANAVQMSEAQRRSALADP